MEQFRTIPTQGRFDNVVDAITGNFQRTYEMLSRLETATTKNLGTVSVLPSATGVEEGTNITWLHQESGVDTFSLYTAKPNSSTGVMEWELVGNYVPTSSYDEITSQELADVCVLT